VCRSCAIDRWRKIGTLAFGYGLTGALGLLLAVPPGYATAVWPSSGIALAALLVWGTRVWPGIWLGSFLVNVWASFSAQGDVTFLSAAIAANIAVGSTIQAMLAALLIRKWVGVSKLFETAPTTLAFAAIVAVCCFVASSWGVVTLKLAGLMEFGALGESWRTWWLGDFIGVLVITPVLMTWRQLLPVESRPWYVAETTGTLVVLTAVTAFVFYYQAPPGVVAYPITFLPLPFLVWIACRTNPGGVAFAACLVSAIAVVATSTGAGPFARSTNESLIFLQSFIGLTTLTGMMLAAAICAHKAAAESLRRITSELQQLALTDELTGVRNRRGFLLLADHAWRLARRARVRCLLMFIDVDGLKDVNDTQGHRAGDELLVDAAQVLSSVFRETDVIGRVGGDEFAILELVDGGVHTDAGSQRLQTQIDDFNRHSMRKYRLSMSYGTEELPATADMTLEALLARADTAMYERKREQRERRDQEDQRVRRQG